MFERRLLTNMVIDALEAVGHPVGDAYAPTVPYGWSDTPKAPGTTFIPYAVVVPGNVSDINGPLAYPHADLWIPYQVTTFGSTREQCEWIADHLRDAIDAMVRTFVDTGDGRYKVVAADTKSIGGIARGGGDDTPVFGQTDTVILFLSKEI